jgi:hypothetical protein
MNPAATASLELRDIHAAPAPSVWPPAPGWWLLAVLLVTVLVVLGVWLTRRYRRYRLQRQIMDEIDNIGDCYSIENIGVFVTGISTLLRRVALQRYPRERVASLTGAAWLRFLDATGGKGEFENGVGQILELGAYAPQTGELPASELLALARRWAKQNLKVAA